MEVPSKSFGKNGSGRTGGSRVIISFVDLPIVNIELVASSIITLVSANGIALLSVRLYYSLRQILCYGCN